MPGIMKYINRISRANGIVYGHRLQEYGIAQCHHPYIRLICRQPGISQEQSAREICVNRSNVTRQLAALEKKELIIRRQDTEDRRVWRVYPTEKMQELLPAVNKVMREWNEFLLGGLEAEELEQLIHILEKLTVRANEAAADYLVTCGKPEAGICGKPIAEASCDMTVDEFDTKERQS